MATSDGGSGSASTSNVNPGAGAGLSRVLMIVAILVLGGFFYWLWVQAQAEAERQAEAMAAAEEGPEEEAPDISEAVRVDVAELGRDMSVYDGQVVLLVDVSYGGPFAQQGFFVDAPTPLLASAPSMVADTLNPVAGRGSMTLAGTVREGGTAVFEGWLAAGTIGESDLVMADFATYYVDVFATVAADGTVTRVGADTEGDGVDEESGSEPGNQP